MKVVHSFDKFKIEKNVKENASFILTNKIGGYCYLDDKLKSRYGGIFFNHGFKVYKAIDNIALVNVPSVDELRNKFSSFERKRGNIIEKFFMPYNFNSMVYELNQEEEIELVLDVRESYKMPQFGRNYEIFEEKGKIVVRYNQDGKFECYLALNYDKSYEPVKRWVKQEYELDRKRESMPFESYVFSALKIKSKQLVISFSFDKEKAIMENDYVMKNIKKLEIKQERYIRKILDKGRKIRDNKLRMAYLCAVNSLNSLVVSIDSVDGIYAGLPWFFQFWARDEAISLNALRYTAKEGNIVSSILTRLINSIEGYKKIRNEYTYGNLCSADTVGWILKRGYELNKRRLNKKIRDIEEIKQNTGLIINNNKETWMDSIDREGARIEIQALLLNSLRCLFSLTGSKVYKELEHSLKEKVRKEFLNKGVLKDGADDSTTRPNMFIAAYVYPELLSNAEWSRCFKNALSRLWLDWGGLSTIDKTNPSFCSEHTGENSKSYHNGDSWFYLNNLGALVLHRADNKRFRGYIEKILDASVNEILWRGAIGHHAELSSAKMLSSEGCLAQAWSAAMFIELVEELKQG